MARAMCWADCEVDLQGGCRSPGECRPACWDREMHKARAAWAHALTRLREPSAAMREAYWEDAAGKGTPEGAMRAMLGAFARETGLEIAGGE